MTRKINTEELESRYRQRFKPVQLLFLFVRPKPPGDTLRLVVQKLKDKIASRQQQVT